MKTLVLITANFPFGTREPFINAEFPFLENEFKRIIIISQNTNSEQTRTLPQHVKVFRYNTSTSLTGFLFFPYLLLKNRRLIASLYNEEVEFRNNLSYALTFKRKKILITKIIKSIQLRDYIKSKLSNEKISSEIIFYSYWLNTGAHAIGMLDYVNSIKIARAHGSDLYEEKTLPGYLPLLKFTSENLDSIFFTSEHGKKYFATKSGSVKTELNVSRLGVIKRESEVNPASGGDEFLIVSCSNLIAIKRIDLIIKALKLISENKQIKWIHFGFGSLRVEMEKLAAEMIGMKERVRYEFKGYIPNDEILRFYSNNTINLFLNTSLTEGVPVSIMEAQCFGIPVIATDVGGVSEVVIEGTGFLLPVNFRPEELAEKISFFMNLRPEEENKFRERIFSSWNQNYNASVNYPDFIRKVNSIFGSSIKESG